ncbi:hypothetical protein UA32_07670 [Photobacterium angustum]|uniref:Polysaccharide pyruvyl transferase domain-containing protein n=1 Tax=Photobacterium angustum TaxID=661 RepID=A0ABX5GYI4_PHOAN|nr:polysaccharide pyruvyl transferase family protein [Photobacterium angustum]KJG39106.1 hypothetical protein UA32_07670 [Photobacterium angustum]PSX01047.1 hypothetical protein C0W27_22480 [Photobacterium angustum]
MSYKYGLIKYSSYNIGDDIQSVAAKRFLPTIDSYIQRERVGSFSSDEKTKLIMNAWWMWEPKNFPPSESIEPLLISMYFRPEIRDYLLSGEVKNYLIKNGPVGCRDTGTAEFLNNNGIPAYFSGCLTLTLEKNKKIKKENFILAVDMPEESIEIIKNNSEYPVYSLSRMLTPYLNSKSRIELAEIILDLYQSAHCVVSPCLHVVLPCLAFETPVLRVNIGNTTGAGTNESTGDVKGRYSGMEHLSHKVELNDFIKGKFSYDFNLPPENPKDYLKIRNDLMKRAEEFTGFNNPVNNKKEFPIINIFQLLIEDKSIEDKVLYYSSSKSLIKALFNKVIFKKNKFDF